MASSLFRKLKLVSEDELERIKEKQIVQYDPNVRSMARLQTQVDTLLDSTPDSLSANERLQLIEMLQNRFRQIQTADTKAPPVHAAPVAPVAPDEALPAAGAEEAIEEPTATGDADLVENILSTISTKRKDEARDHMGEILNNPSILSFNHKLEAVVNGRTIRGSNFLNLFKSLYSSSTSLKNLKGHSDFNNAIGTLELFKVASPKATRRQSLQSSSSLAASARPPGTSIDVKHVYPIKEKEEVD